MSFDGGVSGFAVEVLMGGVSMRFNAGCCCCSSDCWACTESCNASSTRLTLELLRDFFPPANREPSPPPPPRSVDLSDSVVPFGDGDFFWPNAPLNFLPGDEPRRSFVSGWRVLACLGARVSSCDEAVPEVDSLVTEGALTASEAIKGEESVK